MKNVRDLLGVIAGIVLIIMAMTVAVTSILTGMEHATQIPFLTAACFLGAGCVFGDLTLGKIKRMTKRARRNKK